MFENNNLSPVHDKWALLIGINSYQYARTFGFETLNGCVNDVADIKALLTGKFNFPPRHIKVLQDKQATRRAILDAIQSQLVEKAQPGDIVVLYYSGHGSEMPHPTRINGRDQTIVPHDGRDPNGQVPDISGTDLSLAFSGLKTSNSTFIFDSCHSGAILSRKNGKIRAIKPDNRIQAQASERSARPPQSGRLRPPSAAYALLAACAQNELSIEAELNGKPRGLLTYFLCRELRQSTRTQTYRDLIDNIRGVIASENPSQHPQLEGVAIDTCIFGDQEIAANPYILVSPRGDYEVRFSAGAEIGMTSGSIYEIYAPGAKRLTRPEPVIATLQVTAVQDFSAIGHINTGGPVVENSRAIETAHSYQAPVARVSIDEWEWEFHDTLQKVRQELIALSQLRLTVPPEQHDIRVWHEAGDIHMESSSGVLGAVVADDPTAVESIVQRIQHWARWLNLIALSNPTQPTLEVQFKIAPVEEDYFPGSQVQCIVENNSDIDLYIAILDFASDGSIQVIFPAGDPPVLLAKHSLHKLFVLESEPPEQKECGDVLKLIASARQQDFRVLEMDGFKNVPVSDDPLGRLVSAAIFGTSKGQTQWLQPPDWIAINRSLLLTSAKIM